MNKIIGVSALLIAFNVWSAARPITGVSCDGGFYIRTPDKHIHWVQLETQAREEVYQGSSELYAMAQCGTGVISVWLDNKSQQHHAFYSPNCRSIGTERDQTQQIYQGDQAITALQLINNGLTTTFEDGTSQHSSDCGVKASPAALKSL